MVNMNSILKIRRPISSLSLLRFYSYASNEIQSETLNPSFIRPSAIVHPNVLIDQGVSIGPFCTVRSSAKLGNGFKLYSGSDVLEIQSWGSGSGAVIGVEVPGITVIGNNNIIGHYAVVGVKCQDLKYKIIGNNNLIMGSCHVAHDCNIGNCNIFDNSTLLAGHVIVEDYVHHAGAVVVHQFCHIGSFSFIGGGSVVSQDVPKYAMGSGERAELRGLNLEGLRQHGFTAPEIRSLRTAYRKIFMPVNASPVGLEDRLAELEQDTELSKVPVVCSMVQSLRDSFTGNRRGICKFRHWSGS